MKNIQCYKLIYLFAAEIAIFGVFICFINFLAGLEFFFLSAILFAAGVFYSKVENSMSLEMEEEAEDIANSLLKELQIAARRRDEK